MNSPIPDTAETVEVVLQLAREYGDARDAAAGLNRGPRSLNVASAWSSLNAAIDRLAAAPSMLPPSPAPTVGRIMELAKAWCMAWGEWAHDNDPGGAKELAAEHALRNAVSSMLPQSAGTEREAFEAWSAKQEIPGSDGILMYTMTRRRPDGNYDWPATDHAWYGWQARASLPSAQAVLPEPLDCFRFGDKCPTIAACLRESKCRAAAAQAVPTHALIQADSQGAPASPSGSTLQPPAAASAAIPGAEPAAWQERQARRMTDGVITEWSRWYECKARSIEEARAEAPDHIPHEWRPLYTAPARGIDSPEGVETGTGSTAKPQEPGREATRPEARATLLTDLRDLHGMALDAAQQVQGREGKT